MFKATILVFARNVKSDHIGNSCVCRKANLAFAVPIRSRGALFYLVWFLFVFPTGETSAGKSSLINLLLNEEALPTYVLQNTLTICEISYGPRKEAKVNFDKYKPGEEPIRSKGKEFDLMRKYIEQPVDGERRCEKIEIKINNALLKVQTYSDGTR